ncbi:MAG: DUF5362 domain-containing protein [bacterium]|nr:DUF5362 domain-containing protein [bacterium]
MDEQAVVKEISVPMYQAKGWLQFLAVMEILGGIMVAFTIIGIIFAWLPIWQGVILFKAASSAEAAAITGDKTQLVISLRQIKLFFMINGVVMLIGVGFSLLAFFFGGMLAFMG